MQFSNAFYLLLLSTVAVLRILSYRLNAQLGILFIMHFDRKCCESHLSLSLNHFVQTHPLTIVINNQMNIAVSMLQSIHLQTYVVEE